ncbi:MAG: acylneuraminate cytidylyltransferase family protein [Planctomycetes bacterium]|nr:acylneuraminate cytidylyltransferase family protein [Planctomycetota bacterium]
MDKKVLAIITARGGSKGVPRKNIRPVFGKPLIAYSIETAIQVRDRLYRIIVSTDDAEIADISRHFGAEVPFMRPPELAADKTPTLPVLQHAVRFVEEQDKVRLDWVLLLQPTSPLRTKDDILAALELAQLGSCDSVISVVQTPTHPLFMKRIENGQLLSFSDVLVEKEGTRRQDAQPPAYVRNGAIYLTLRDVLMERNSIWGRFIRPYMMPPERSVNVDSELDLKLVKVMLQSGTDAG